VPDSKQEQSDSDDQKDYEIKVTEVRAGCMWAAIAITLTPIAGVVAWALA